MKNNKKNRKRTFNYNKVNNQYKENLEILKKRIKDIEKDRNMSENDKGKNLSNEFFNFILNKLPKNKELTDLINIISETIKNNQGSALYIVNGFTHGCIAKNQEIEDIDKIISTITDTDEIKNNPYLESNIRCGFELGRISQKQDLEDKDINKISEIVINNPDSVLDIIDSFTQCCIDKDQGIEDIGNIITKIIKTDGIKNDPNLTFNIVNCFTQGCIDKNQKIEDIGNVITKIIKTDEIKNNPGLTFDIVNCFIQGCIDKNQKIKDIGNVITKIIKTNEIKDNQNLVFNIVDSFVQTCLMEKPDNIKDIAESFSNLINKMEKKTKDTLKPIFSLIVSKYFMNTLTNSSNEQSSEDNKKEETEEQLFNCYKELFHVENEQGFQDIPLKELSDLQDEYLKEIFKEECVNGGVEYETFLKMACNLIPKSKDNEKPTVENLEDKNKQTVADLEKQKDIFKDLKFIRLNNKDGIESKEQLFGKIGLTENDFGAKRESKGSDFSIVYCSYLGHAFIMIIDKTQEWEEAKNPETESIYLIDSSQDIEYKKTNEYTSLNKKKQIFETAPTLNDHFYQLNGTCWLNAMSAVGFLLEKQQECIDKQNKEQKEQIEQAEQQPRESYGLSIKKLLMSAVRELLMSAVGFLSEKQQEQVGQTGQQVKKPYGLSIKELLGGFLKGQSDDKHITMRAIIPEELSSFEQGICDYSTEHFYPLINHSDEEKYTITNFLAKKVKENSNSQKELKEMSKRLEESRKIQETKLWEKQDTELRLAKLEVLTKEQKMMFEQEIRKKQNEERIIYGNYLKKSLEQIAKDGNRLKEFCTKLSILDLNQGENLNNKNHFRDIVRARINNGSIPIYNSK